ncbi:MAG TPA: FGLLP motif-containing membrane protein, partial [Acidothermaceae bacterium]|nr:FGLLP motif-containing membrane protein [Acidothermaceae bacterium]
QAYAVIASGSGGKVLDVRGLWDGYYVAPGGAKYHNPVDFLTEDLASGALTGTDNGTDGPATISGSISGRTITATIAQPATNYSAKVTWVLSADGTQLIAGGITDPNAINAFVLYRHGAAVGGNAVTSGKGVTSGPAPITALPTPAEAFSSPGRIVASAAISIAALLFITFPANLFNKTFEENYDVIAAWWEPRLRRFRRKPPSSRPDAEGPATTASSEPAVATEPAAGPESAAGPEPAAATEPAAAAETDDRWTFGIVVVAGAILGGLLNPKFGANSASVNSFIATLLSVIVGTVVGTVVGFAYRRRKKYDVTRHFEALPAGLAIAALCVILSRVSDFQPGYLYGVVCGVAFAGTLKKNESGHLVALGHLATIGIAVIAWFVWVPVNHAAQHHTGVFPLVILDDLLASLFVGGLVGSVINLIPVRFMPGHTLASWHRGAWMAVFGVAAFGMTLIVVFPSRHNHAGHAPLITIIVLFVLFGGGSLVFREYFSRREKRLELAKTAGATAAISIPEAGAVPADAAPVDEVPADDGQIPVPRAEELDPTAPLEPVVENASALGIETPRAETSGL